MALETVDEIYQVVRKQPKEEQLRLAARIINGVLSPAYVDAIPSTQPQEHERKDEQAETPEWFRFAVEASKIIDKRAQEMGVELPSDLAENHDYYAHGKPRK